MNITIMRNISAWRSLYRCATTYKRHPWSVIRRCYADDKGDNGNEDGVSSPSNVNNKEQVEKTETSAEKGQPLTVKSDFFSRSPEGISKKYDRKVPMAHTERLTWSELKTEMEIARSDWGQVACKSGAERQIPRETDVAIIGGGLVGTATAYWLRLLSKETLRVVVIERDNFYSEASSLLSVGGIRHQFSIPGNVQMSMFTTEFMRRADEYLRTPGGERVDIGFNHQGYLFLAAEHNVEKLSEMVKMQRELGAETVILTKSQLADKFPWLNLDDVEIGSYGMHGEGWFDPWTLLRAMKAKAINLGVTYVQGEVTDFVKQTPENSARFVADIQGKTPKLHGVTVKGVHGELVDMRFAFCVNAAGAWAGEVARMAGIGTGEGVMEVPLPIEPRKRCVYVAHCPDGPGIEAPLTVDMTGAYFRREGLGGHYLLGASPPEDCEPCISSLEVNTSDYNFFEEEIWPNLAHRIPAFENLKVKSAWAGYYDYNYFDQNLVIGPHPEHVNFVMACGMSGHGIQQAVAIGHAVAELFIYDTYKTIDLFDFGFNRFLTNDPLKEVCLV